MFAYTYSELDHTIAAAAERAIAIQARERYDALPGSGRGLKGNDGAAQAGMIRAMVERRLPADLQCAILARFSVRSSAERLAACHLLAQLALTRAAVGQVLTGRQATLEALIGRHFGIKVDPWAIADREDVHIQTVRKWQAEVRRWLRPLDDRALYHAEGVLCDAGIVAYAGE